MCQIFICLVHFLLFFFSQFWTNRTNNFHHFVKLALTKNPKKRPTAEKLLQVSRKKQHSINTKTNTWFFSSVISNTVPECNIKSNESIMSQYSFWLCLFARLLVFQHPFVSQPLSRTLAIELLDKANNPDHSTYNDFDDDDPEPEVTFDLLKITLANIVVIVFLPDLIFFPWNHTLLSFH